MKFLQPTPVSFAKSKRKVEGMLVLTYDALWLIVS